MTSINSVAELQKLSQEELKKVSKEQLKPLFEQFAKSEDWNLKNMGIILSILKENRDLQAVFVKEIIGDKLEIMVQQDPANLVILREFLADFAPIANALIQQGAPSITRGAQLANLLCEFSGKLGLQESLLTNLRGAQFQKPIGRTSKKIILSVLKNDPVLLEIFDSIQGSIYAESVHSKKVAFFQLPNSVNNASANPAGYARLAP
jgi:hypothetical protein